MKVNILTVDDVKISKWRWWSNWIDIALFNFAGRGYILQMRISRRNAKQFRCVMLGARFSSIPYATTHEVEDLTQMTKMPS